MLYDLKLMLQNTRTAIKASNTRFFIIDLLPPKLSAHQISKHICLHNILYESVYVELIKPLRSTD